MTVPERHRSRAGAVVGIAAIALLATLAGACRGGQPEPPRDAAAQRARDSAIAESNLPGAQGVRGALNVADSAAARQARRDSLEREP